MRINIMRSRRDAVIPAYQTAGAAGADLHACCEATVILPPGVTRTIPTGICVEIPHGYEAQVRSRSGLAHNHGIMVLNSPGTIDSDYRGEIGVILHNTSQHSFMVRQGDRIAQMVICPVIKAEWSDIGELSATDRGNSAFGSTGRT